MFRDSAKKQMNRPWVLWWGIRNWDWHSVRQNNQTNEKHLWTTSYRHCKMCQTKVKPLENLQWIIFGCIFRFAGLSADPFCSRSHCDHLRDWRSFVRLSIRNSATINLSCANGNGDNRTRLFPFRMVAHRCAILHYCSLSHLTSSDVVIVITFHLFYNVFLHSHSLSLSHSRFRLIDFSSTNECIFSCRFHFVYVLG